MYSKAAILEELQRDDELAARFRMPLRAVASPAMGQWGTCPPSTLQLYGYAYKLTNYRPNCVYNIKVYLAHIRRRGRWRLHMFLLLDLLRLKLRG